MQAAATSALSTAQRSHPTSEVRGSSRGYQTVTAEERPRGATPHPKSGGAAERRYPASEVRGVDERSYPTSEVRGSGWEELPHAPKPEAKSGGWEELPHAATPEARGGSWEEQPTPEARGSGREDQLHVQGAKAAQAQDGLQELSHTEGQEGWQ